MTQCINCGRPIADDEDCLDVIIGYLCVPCDDESNKIAAMLSNGIELQYEDGTKETIYS